MGLLDLDGPIGWLREHGGDAAMVARLTRDLPRYLCHPMTPAQVREGVVARLSARPERLLRTVEQTIFGNPESPYLKLLRIAGCEPGDLRALVRQEGVEGALQTLADRGVYATFDELKGRREVVRGSQRLHISEQDLDNPRVRPHLILQTGGSGGRPSRVRYSLAYFEDWAASFGIALQAHHAEQADHVYWWPVPFHGMLASARLGRPPIAWYYPLHPLPRLVRLGGWYLWLLSALAGRPLPPPRRGDLESPEPVVAWIAEHVRRDRTLMIRTMPSTGARAARIALESGRSLAGVTFLLGGEPVTEARRRQIEAAGARLIVLYSSVELIGLSYSCAAPRSADDVHVMLDMYGLAQRRREASPEGPVVDATLFTTLSPLSAKIALNMELGDYARVEERDCDCLLGALGLRVHLSEVRSFEKLTGEGVTFARSNLERILEEVLPARFGGTGLEYQFAEEEAENGATRLVLRVSPSVGELDPSLLRSVLLAELGRGGSGSRYHAGIWRSARTIEVRREQPLVTPAGKVLPFHLLRRSETGGAAARRV